jgi:5-formyltetrahydrofolate cyclo-ligase
MLMMKAAIITNRVLQSSIYQNAQSIAIFLSMPGREVSTRDIVLQALKDGKEVFVPYLHPGDAPKSKVMDMLQLVGENDFNSLKPDAWGIPSLSSESVHGRRNALGGLGVLDKAADNQHGYPKLHLIFMPAVAFDQFHQRLGHGKGFYDRYLHTYKTILESTQPDGRMPYLGKARLEITRIGCC